MVMADISGNTQMPERDSYLRPEPVFCRSPQEIQATRVIANMFKLAGWDEAKPPARRACSEFAEASLSPTELRDPKATDHKLSFAQLGLSPHLIAPDYFKHKQLPQDVDLNVQEPKFLQEVDRQMQQTALDWEVVQMALAGPDCVAFCMTLLWKKICLQRQIPGRGHGNEAAVEALRRVHRFCSRRGAGQAVRGEIFPARGQARMQEMVRNLLAAMKDDIVGLPWMSDETKQKALVKLATFNPEIGTRKDYSSVQISRGAFFEDAMNGRKFVVEDIAQVKARDHGRWGITTPTSDASLANRLLNEIVFPAGILQPPAFNMQAVDAVNYRGHRRLATKFPTALTIRERNNGSSQELVDQR